MIVKNESKIIVRLLESVADLIDTYCICDTGSTDNTIALIQDFFQGKAGKLIQEPFKNFEYNRSFALKACEELDADYVLLLDADMIFWRDPAISAGSFKETLSKFDYWQMFQGTDTFYYKNTRIVRNKHYYYKGVTHEYIEAPQHAKPGLIPKQSAFIRDIGDGGSKQDKFHRDIKLLRDGLEAEPKNERYMFYLANSLKDSNQKALAIEMYQKRIAAGGWIEEVWQSYYQIGKTYNDMGEKEKAICAWMSAYHEFPNRIENLYEIVQHYRIEGKHKLAYLFYQTAVESKNKYPERDYLFMQKDVYDYKLDYEFSIFGYYYNPLKRDLAELTMNLLLYPFLEDGIGRNLLSNYKFYAPSAIEKDTRTWENHDFGIVVSTIGNTLDLNGFIRSSPTFCAHPFAENQMYVIVRFVNYHIEDNGGYHCEDTIHTKNVIALLEKTTEWKLVKENVLLYNTDRDNVYVGLEDMRICLCDGKIHYSANRGLSRGKMVVETGWINRISFKTEQDKLLRIENQAQIEKNWVFLPSPPLYSYMVYQWSPMQIGTITKDELKIILSYSNVPWFFKHLRGSTNGVKVHNEIWVLTHLVSYEDRRYYYHCMVILNDKFEYVRHSKLFTFEKNKVEYCLGMQYDANSDEFLFAFSAMDRESKWMTLKKSWFRS